MHFWPYSGRRYLLGQVSRHERNPKLKLVLAAFLTPHTAVPLRSIILGAIQAVLILRVVSRQGLCLP
jgi:hypothetical protein